MSRSTGLRLGPRRFEIVALEGSTKKPKVRAVLSGRGSEGEDALSAQRAALEEALKPQRKDFAAEEIGLTIDGGLGVYRHLLLPFADREKIEEVIRFEVESKIPQADIDDLVVDFFITEATPVESQLLVTAVPKLALKQRLDVASKVGLEPVEAELETASLFHAAEFVGALSAGAAQLLVHLGERTTSIVVAVNGKLKTMRALHLALDGNATGAEAPAAEAEGEAAADGANASVGSAVESVLDPVQQEKMRQRLLREFLRMLTSSESGVPFDAIWVCGLVPVGLVGSQVSGVTVRLLDPLEVCGATELPAQERARYTLAFGAAWKRMGGGQLTPKLRRDDLAYAGTFERLELALGVLGLLLLTVLFSRLIIVKKQILPRSADVAMWMDCVRNYTIGRPEEGSPGFLSDPPKVLVTTLKGILAGSYNESQTPLEQLELLKGQMDVEIKRFKTQLGTGDSTSQPQSALTATNLVFDVFRELGEERIGRLAIRKMDAKWIGASGSGREPEHIAIRLDLSFFAETDQEAGNHYNTLIDELKDQPWCLDATRLDLEQITGEIRGLAANGFTVKVDTSKSPQAEAEAEQANATAAESEASG
jgi:Tfp pilus assembly PilM family ATPase